MLPHYEAPDQKAALQAAWEWVRAYGHPADIFNTDNVKVATVAVTWHPPVSTGYVCKKCNGPAPVGIGYATSEPATGDVETCPCGYSRREVTPE